MVRALNADRPWDELIREQLAGDEMVAPPYANLAPADVDKLIATGFLRMAPDGTGDPGADPNVARNDVVAETIKIVSTALLGLTVGCAQCHAHRYDPISHEDYYRFRALFEPAFDWKHWRGPRERLVSLWTDADRAARRRGRCRGQADRERARRRGRRAGRSRSSSASWPLRPRSCARRSARPATTPVAKRTAEQTQLLKDYPRVNVTAGNVSLYDGKAHRAMLAAFASRVAEAQKRRPAEDDVQALTEVPGQVPDDLPVRTGRLRSSRARPSRRAS